MMREAVELAIQIVAIALFASVVAAGIGTIWFVVGTALP